MSDFVSEFWAYYVGVGVIISILACAWLLWIVGRKSPQPTTWDQVKASTDADGNTVGTTGHVWDEDLQELNNPLPRWWAWLFVITILFGFAYLAIYPGVGRYAGSAGWSQQKEHEADRLAAEARVAPLYAKFTSQSTEQLAASGEAMAIGERLFMNNCAQCHGSDARGSKGFPNLADKDWLYGGTPEKIHESISKGRRGTMPSMAAAVGSADDIVNLANYVLSLSDSGNDSAKAVMGRDSFTACAACHGADGKGNQAVGAPNLTDKIWLHGFGADNIIAAINKGHTSNMPAHESKLTDAQIRLLTGYVWRLSNETVTASASPGAGTPAGKM